MQGTAASFRPSRWPCAVHAEKWFSWICQMICWISNISTLEPSYLWRPCSEVGTTSVTKEKMHMYTSDHFSFKRPAQSSSITIPTKKRHACHKWIQKWIQMDPFGMPEIYWTRLLHICWKICRDLSIFVELCCPPSRRPQSPVVAKCRKSILGSYAIYCDILRHDMALYWGIARHTKIENTTPPQINTNHLHPLQYASVKVCEDSFILFKRPISTNLFSSLHYLNSSYIHLYSMWCILKVQDIRIGRIRTSAVTLVSNCTSPGSEPSCGLWKHRNWWRQSRHIETYRDISRPHQTIKPSNHTRPHKTTG